MSIFSNFFKKEAPLLGLQGSGGGLGFLAGSASGFSATGGSAGGGNGIQPGDGYTYWVFTNNGPNTFVVDGTADAEYIAVAGGGGGSDRGNGCSGGGAGGLLTNWPGPSWTVGTSRGRGPALPLGPGTYTITIGEGGYGGDEQQLPARGHPGANTTLAGPTISTITCYGGGAGGTENYSSKWNQTPGGNGINPGNANNKIGDTGGSGGGTNNGGPNGGLAGGLSYGSGQSMQGNAGGSNSTSYVGSGGGGMGGMGGNSGVADGGPGGNGAGFAGVPPAYGTPGPNASYRYFAGGGGGGGNSNGNGGSASYGGGGRGSNQPGSTTSTGGTTNTGGGGGGGSDGQPPNSYRGQPGGPGIVIIRVSD